MLHKETVEKRTFDLLKRLQALPTLENTLLVGGTSLALQLGHRISTDLDLFTTEEIDTELIQDMLDIEFNFTPRRILGKSVIGDIDGVKIDIIYHPFKWINNPLEQEKIRLASLEDITAMKLHAVINSGIRPKDFVDLAYLSTIFCYDTMKEFLLQKYPKYDPIMADRAINYFDEIEASLIPEIKMTTEKLNFEKIKKRLVQMTDKPKHIFKTNPLENKTKEKITSGIHF